MACCFNTQPPEGGWLPCCRWVCASDCFNTQPPEGGWARIRSPQGIPVRFQHTAARRRLDKGCWAVVVDRQFQHTAARRRLGLPTLRRASSSRFQHTAARRRLATSSLCEVKPMRFNTQPPEGGWLVLFTHRNKQHRFQHTAARRRLVGIIHPSQQTTQVSTHSRPKAAGSSVAHSEPFSAVSTHSRPKAAGKHAAWQNPKQQVSTHSRPKAAGAAKRKASLNVCGFNTQPPEGGWLFMLPPFAKPLQSFNTQPPEGGWWVATLDKNHHPVSTHSRPKAAGKMIMYSHRF